MAKAVKIIGGDKANRFMKKNNRYATKKMTQSM